MLYQLYNIITFFSSFYSWIFIGLLVFDKISNTPIKRAHIRFPISFFTILLVMVLIYINIAQKINPNDFSSNIIILLMWAVITIFEYKNSRLN